MKPHLRVFKLLTDRLKPLGFERRRTSWWQFQRDGLWCRVHVHKFTFADRFRVHSTVHVVGAEDDAVSLNGPCSNDGWFIEQNEGDGTRRYDFSFSDSDVGLARCADEIRDYIAQCYLPWFSKQRTASTDLKLWPNQALLPTPTAVTDPAAQAPRQP